MLEVLQRRFVDEIEGLFHELEDLRVSVRFSGQGVALEPRPARAGLWRSLRLVGPSGGACIVDVEGAGASAGLMQAAIALVHTAHAKFHNEILLNELKRPMPRGNILTRLTSC